MREVDEAVQKQAEVIGSIIWVAEFNTVWVRVPPVIDEGRYIEISPGATAGMAFFSGHIRAEDGAALDQRLDAIGGHGV